MNLRSSEAQCLELSGGQGTLEAVSQRESQDLAEGGRHGEGEHWVDLGHTLHRAPIGILTAFPAPGVLLLSMLGLVLCYSPCTQPLASRGTENGFLGLTTLAGCRGGSAKLCPGPSIL